MKKTIITYLFLACISLLSLQAQDYLHADGKFIYDANGEEVIIRGIGTGNWMLQEGYMMKSADVAPTQHEFRAKLEETIGTEKTDSFYNAWLAWHFTRTDVDSMKAWGFNTVRVAMHYKWFTPPIEEENPGEITFLDKGFTMMDSLLDWCGDNEMYLILDMHGTPGGQGTDAAISDYDDSKPSLWESEANKEKLIALWRKLAERYSDEPWMGGYDLINEPNWEFEESGNAPLWQIYKDITNAIREVDTNHMIIVEGNWFANDYAGVPDPWDDNLVFSFHKYWTYNTLGSIQYAIDLRNNHNVPIWLGETGENSNTWFTNLIALCESNNIGWSWWPVKKGGINNVLRVEVNEDYTALIEYWKGNGSAPTEEEAFDAVMQFAENHKIENCVVQYDVIDAMIRQPFSYESIPFTSHKPGSPVFFVDYDLGRNNVAYFDQDTANYHLDQDGNYTNWNQGHSYRNDGVDIEPCQDSETTNGYNVGWTGTGEWLTYTVSADSTAAYALKLRYAAGGNGGSLRLLSDGIPITGNIALPGTGGWQTWQTITVDDVVLPQGSHKIKVEITQEGANLNYFEFSNPKSVSDISFLPVSAETDAGGYLVKLILNKDIDSDPAAVAASEFMLMLDNTEMTIDSFYVEAATKNVLFMQLTDQVYYGGEILLSWTGSSIISAAEPLAGFTDLQVINNLPVRFNIPGRIQAQDFFRNEGFELEICTDVSGDFNTAYANPGDFLDYRVHVGTAGHYQVNYRIASERNNAEIVILTDQSGEFLPVDTVAFSGTGAWQNWETQSSVLELPAGRYHLRILVKQSEYNLNWFEVINYDFAGYIHSPNLFTVFPNPASSTLHITFRDDQSTNFRLSIYNINGSLFKNIVAEGEKNISLDISNLNSGVYSLVLEDGNMYFQEKIIVQ